MLRNLTILEIAEKYLELDKIISSTIESGIFFLILSFENDNVKVIKLLS